MEPTGHRAPNWEATSRRLIRDIIPHNQTVYTLVTGARKMSEPYANQFSEIPDTLATNDALRDVMLDLIGSEPMPGKVLEGGSRLNDFRAILTRLTNGELSINDSFAEAETALPRDASQHANNNRVFPSGWAERLVRTQVSRFYNQAVLQTLLGEGYTRCFVPHSSAEKPDSNCSVHLAGSEHETQMLLDRLLNTYSDGNFSKSLKIPDHPHCTHTITPPRS